MLLSVCLITYNQVGYIEQAIESVLMQEAGFTWELVIADDGSTDGTRDILLKYKKEYPELIKLILQKKNVGAYRNWMDLITYPQSNYIAYLDGDDYWTDAHKLQKQVFFLEANPDYAICTHHVDIVKDGIVQPSENFGLRNDGNFNIAELAEGNFIYSPSVVYRNGLIDEFPAWLEMSPVGDYVLHLLNAKKGRIKYMSDTMAIYRQHSNGSWWAQPSASMLEKWIQVLSFLLSEKFDKNILQILNNQKRKICLQYLLALLDTDPVLFKTKLDELTTQLPELSKDLVFNKFIDDHFELREVKNKYNNLKNSRLRKYLSYFFKQLKT